MENAKIKNLYTLEETIAGDGVINLENNVYINLYSGKIRHMSEENNG